MRIVQIVENLEIGGLERLAVDLGVEQKAAGHSPAIYCISQAGAFAAEAERLGVRVAAFEKEPGLSPRTVMRIAAKLRNERIDVVHTHNAAIHHYGVAAARLGGVPVVVNTRHGLNTVPPKPRSEKIFRATLPWTDAVILVSENARDFFIRERGLPASKARVILNGVPLGKFSTARAAPGAGPGIRFGTVGRLVEVKDHAGLIRAFAGVRSRLAQAELHIVGDGPLRAKLEELARGVDGVVLHGARYDVADFLRGLDVFVMSSLSEGLPVVLLEAMAAGLPVVSTKVGGIPEVAPEDAVAWYCVPGDADGLATVMLAAAHAPDLARRGQKAFEIVSSRFSMETMWRQYEEVFLDLAVRKGVRRAAAARRSDPWPESQS